MDMERRCDVLELTLDEVPTLRSLMVLWPWPHCFISWLLPNSWKIGLAVPACLVQLGVMCDGSTPETPSKWLWILSSQTLTVPALRTVHCKQSKWRNSPPGSQSSCGVDYGRADGESESGDQALGSIGSFDFTALIAPTFLYSSPSWYHRAALPVPVCIFSLFFCFRLYYSCSVFFSFLILSFFPLFSACSYEAHTGLFFFLPFFVCCFVCFVLCPPLVSPVGMDLIGRVWDAEI